MLVKFLARGTGSAGAAARYLLGERDAAGKPREGVEVLRGNPDMVAAVADTLAFEHKYTSGVIAWAPEDRPTDEQIEAVLDAFEKTAWAGLEPDRYAWAAVLHRERGGSAHVHVVAALREAGLEVPRQGRDYLTALDPETGDRWRLKGELYGENFERGRLTDRLRRRLESERREIEELTASELERARRELAARCEYSAPDSSGQ